jgi:DNA replication protein DnaC
MCEICNDRGIYITGDNVAAVCNCMQIKAVQNKLKNAGIPDKQVFLDGFDLRYYSETEINQLTQKTFYQAAKDALTAVRKFTEDPTDGIALVGPAGRGKTLLARCAAHELLQKGKELIFIEVPMLLAEIKDTYNENSDRSELQVLDAARKVNILFLDDLGAHNYTEWVQTQLYSILNYRMNNHLPTFITSNLTLEQMAEKLGERIASRVVDLCAVHFIESQGDIRAMKRARKNKADRSA